MGKKIYKFALVGCGRIAGKHVDAINSIDEAALVAVCDSDIKRAENLGNKLRIPFFGSYDEMLQNVDVDIVNILTPSGLHPDHTMDIVKKYNKHIVCEKPMALTLPDADRMIETCDEFGCRLFIVKQNRYNLPVIKTREAIDRGLLGRIIMGSVRVRWCRDQKYYDQDQWRGTWELDGGVITNQASHHIDLLEWMLGEPVSVIGKTATYCSDIEVDDTALAIITFKSGAMGLIEATTATRPKDLEGSLSILGEKGSIVIGGFSVNRMTTWNISGQSKEEQEATLTANSEEPPNVYGYGHMRYLEHVLDCIKHNKKALVDGIEGRRSLELINAIYESAETGKEVVLRFEPKLVKLGKKSG
jgi:predicted dehydrogenase